MNVKAKLTYGTASWKKEETGAVRTIAQTASIVSGILFDREHPPRIFQVERDCPNMELYIGGRFIRVDLLEEEFDSSLASAGDDKRPSSQGRSG